MGISLKGKWVTVTYQTPEGRLEQAQQDLEYFYDYWVKMYLRRSNRAKLPPPTEPTVFVTWEGNRKGPGISNRPGLVPGPPPQSQYRKRVLRAASELLDR